MPHPPDHAPPPVPARVFVYGTLRRGEKNHQRYLAGRYHAWAAGVLRGRLFFEPREGYPFVVPGEDQVHGEIYHLDPDTARATLAELDRLEDYDPADEAGSLYLRRRAEARLEDGRRVEVWVYYWNSAKIGRPVAGGDFSRRGREQS